MKQQSVKTPELPSCSDVTLGSSHQSLRCFTLGRTWPSQALLIHQKEVQNGTKAVFSPSCTSCYYCSLEGRFPKVDHGSSDFKSLFILIHLLCCDSQGTPTWSMPSSASGTCFTSWPTCPRTPRPSRKPCSARRKLLSPFLAPTPRKGSPWRARGLLLLPSRGH